MSITVPCLNCNVNIENYDKNGNVLNKIVIGECKVSLMRNNLNDLLLTITDIITQKQRNVSIVRNNNIVMNTKFAMSEGKASINVKDQNRRIFISNCPSNELCTFLKCLALKYVNENKPIKGEELNRRLESTKSCNYEDISPLTAKDIKRNVLSNRSNTLNGNESSPKSSKGSLMISSRKRLSNELSQNKCKKMNMMPSPVRKLRVLNPFKLSDEQRRVMSAVLNGKSIFFTGSAGTGKSYLLNHLLSRLPPETTFATASTGIAACHINGITFHMFAGIGTAVNTSAEECAQKIMSNVSKTIHWRKCQCLIIDEISMIDGDFFDRVETIAQIVRGNDKPFGGIQLVLCGDFLQLPPVNKQREKKSYCFESKSWNRCIDYCFELTKVKRQTDDTFIKVLQSLRIGKCTEEVCNALVNTAVNDIEKDGSVATKLFTHRNDVDSINNNHLLNLKGKSYHFKADDSDTNLTLMMDTVCPSSRSLELKVGAQVMLNKNLDTVKGLVNGACGRVIRFEKRDNFMCPVVRFVNKCESIITPERWSVKTPTGKVVTRKQLPLHLAWALSIHKSQGMTLDSVEISLSRVFEYGQSYVALSRAKSLSGLKVTDFSPNSVFVDSTVIEFYQNLKYC